MGVLGYRPGTFKVPGINDQVLADSIGDAALKHRAIGAVMDTLPALREALSETPACRCKLDEFEHWLTARLHDADTEARALSDYQMRKDIAAAREVG